MLWPDLHTEFGINTGVRQFERKKNGLCPVANSRLRWGRISAEIVRSDLASGNMVAEAHSRHRKGAVGLKGRRGLGNGRTVVLVEEVLGALRPRAAPWHDARPLSLLHWEPVHVRVVPATVTDKHPPPPAPAPPPPCGTELR